MKLLHQKLEKQNHNKNKGQALVEAVIIIPVSIFLILVTIQISLLYNSYLILNYAVYCGARAGAVHFLKTDRDSVAGFSGIQVKSSNFEEASSIAKKAVRTVLIPHSPIEAFLTKIEVDVEHKTFSVKAIYPAKLLVKLFGILPNVQITASSRMVIEGI